MKRENSIFKKISVFAAFLSVLFFSSCLKSNDNTPNTPVAGLMAFNLAPDQEAIGIKLSGNNLTNNALSYINYTGGYLPIYPGKRSVDAFSANSGLTFSNSEFTFDENIYYSLFVVGTEDAYQNVIVNDSLNGITATPGKALIRYINAIVNPGESEVTIDNEQGNVLSQNAAFPTVSDFVEVDAGEIEIAINNGSNINTNRTITIAEKKVYTILFTGIPEATDDGKKVQIKYVENGTLAEGDTAQQGVSLRSPNAILVQ